MASTRTARRQLAGDFVRLPGSRRPFKRMIALMDAMAAIVSKGLLPIDRQMEIDALPPLVSRGHGGRHRVKQRLVDGRRMQDRSKYDPREEDVKHLRAPSEHMAKKMYRRSTPPWMREIVEKVLTE